MTSRSIYDETRVTPEEVLIITFLILVSTTIFVLMATNNIFWQAAFFGSSALIFIIFVSSGDDLFTIRFKEIIDKNNITGVHITDKDARKHKINEMLNQWLYYNIIAHIFACIFWRTLLFPEVTSLAPTRTILPVYTYFSVIGIILIIKMCSMAIELIRKD